MSVTSEQAESAVKKLFLSDENQLYETLGIRSKAIARDIDLSSSFEPQVTYDETQMGLMDDVRALGRRIFRRLNYEAYKLLCGIDPEDETSREELLNAIGISPIAVGTALSTLLVTHLGIAPAIAGVVATIVVKRYYKKTYEEFCTEWKKFIM